METTLGCAEAGNSPKTHENSFSVAAEVTRLESKFPNRSHRITSQKAPEDWRAPTVSFFMNTSKRMVTSALVLFFVLMQFAGCERRPNSSQNTLNITWKNLLQTSRATILNGSWEQSESAWGELQRDDRTRDHLSEWIQLQVEILEKTENDPLKNQLRLGAIQQMYFETEASRPHFDWLKRGIETSLFKEQGVQQKAQDLLHDLQK
jgi:hypothetical protein